MYPAPLPRRSPGPAAKLIRLELEEFQVPPTRNMRGRVYMELIKPAEVKRIELVGIDASVHTHQNEKINVTDKGSEKITHLPTNEHRHIPSYYDHTWGNMGASRHKTTIDPVVRPLRFGVGSFAVPLILNVPPSEWPSFSYAHPRAVCAFVVSSSVRANIFLNNEIYITETLPIWVPALGGNDCGLRSVYGTVELLCPRKYYVRGEDVKVAVGDSAEDSKVKSVEAGLYCRVRCHVTNFEEVIELVKMEKLDEKTEGESEVVREYDGSNRSSGPGKWAKWWEKTDLTLPEHLPISYSADGFDLIYFIKVKVDDVEYEGIIFVVDYLTGANFRPPQIRSDLHTQCRFYRITPPDAGKKK